MLDTVLHGESMPRVGSPRPAPLDAKLDTAGQGDRRAESLGPPARAARAASRSVANVALQLPVEASQASPTEVKEVEVPVHRATRVLVPLL